MDSCKNEYVPKAMTARRGACLCGSGSRTSAPAREGRQCRMASQGVHSGPVSRTLRQLACARMRSGRRFAQPLLALPAPSGRGTDHEDIRHRRIREQNIEIGRIQNGQCSRRARRRDHIVSRDYACNGARWSRESRSTLGECRPVIRLDPRFLFDLTPQIGWTEKAVGSIFFNRGWYEYTPGSASTNLLGSHDAAVDRHEFLWGPRVLLPR